MTRKKIKLGRREGLYLKDVSTKGHGVFCTQDIKKGAVLEISPSVVLNEAATGHVDKTILVNYTFELGKPSKRLRDRARIRRMDQACVVIMGVASFCNHDEDPNAEILWEDRGGMLYYTLRARRNIPKNTEICTSYGDGWFDDRR